MIDPCKLCNGIICCGGRDEYCSNYECCDPFICLCSGLKIEEQVSRE